MSPKYLVFRDRPSRRVGRRIVDLGIAMLALAVAAPLLLLAALAIYLEDRGPVLFVQHRVGRFERLFRIYKLRTMRTSACGAELSPTRSGDPRVTRVGYWLRKMSIDELPQLFNVLRGDMTLVGPRPEMPFLVRSYEPWQHLRHLTKPGVTGLWQVRARSTIPLHLPEATVFDIQYIRTASPRTDGAILIETIRSIVFAQGAY